MKKDAWVSEEAKYHVMLNGVLIAEFKSEEKADKLVARINKALEAASDSP